MSYNTLATAKDLVGVDLTQGLLDEAQGYIHRWTWYRWSTNHTVDTFSSKDFKVFVGQRHLLPRQNTFTDENVALPPRSSISLFLKPPIISIDYVTIDNNAQTEGTDYEYRADTGELKLISFAFISSESLTGVGDIKASYYYGYDATHYAWPIVLGAEARIALLLKNNPLILSQISMQGDSANYGSDPIMQILKNVPRMAGLRAINR